MNLRRSVKIVRSDGIRAVEPMWIALELVVVQRELDGDSSTTVRLGVCSWDRAMIWAVEDPRKGRENWWSRRTQL